MALDIPSRWLALAVVTAAHVLVAQDMAPRAYVITPLQSNAVTLTWGFYDGGLNFSGNIPLVATVPYGVGTFEASALGRSRSAYRSGLLDLGIRFSVNLIGAPAMRLDQFGKWRQKTILGASVRVIAPTGQYSSERLINWGLNRWAFKPELGYSRRLGNWLVDGYGGAWFYT